MTFIVTMVIVLMNGAAYYFVINQAIKERTVAQLESVSILKASRFAEFIQADLSDVKNLAEKVGVTPNARDIMTAQLHEGEDFTEFFLMDLTGKVTQSSDPSQEGKYKASEPYFNEGKKNAFVQYYYYDLSLEKPATTMSAPLHDATGNVIGVVAGRINLDRVSQFMTERSGLGETGETYLINKFDMAITDLRADQGGALRTLINTKGVKECGKGKSGYGEYTNYKNIPVIGYFEWIPQSEVCLLTEINQSEAFLPIKKFQLLIVVVCGAMLLIGWIFLRLLALRITRSLVDLVTAVEKFGVGNLETRANIDTDDEIGVLGRSFNSMAEKLHGLYADMEGRVKEKTEELADRVREGEESKKAILNLLEDIEAEKRQVEKTVTERTKELRDEKARFLASVNSLRFGFAIVDMEGKFIISNPILTEILGSGDEVKSIQEISGKMPLQSNLFTELIRCSKEKCVVELKDVLFGVKYLRFFLTPVFAGEDQAESIGGVLLVEDVTEAKVLERSRDEFFSIASHELRTPLTAIRGNSEMLLEMYADKFTDNDMKEMLSDIASSSVRLINIVNDFLEVSRLEQGKMSIKKEDFDMGEVIERVIRNMTQVAEKHSVRLAYERPEQVWPAVHADKDRVEQVLFNLVSNAVKFTKQGSVTISVAPQPDFLRVEVTDTGIGISPQNQGLLFRKFEQAGEKVLARDVTQGTGLGLYISRLIMTNMGGSIELERSELGQGSTFAFTVPLAHANISAPASI